MLDAGCWAGHSIYPETKMDEARMVALVKKYGAERIIINSAADWGVSDPLKVPKTRDAMRAAGIAEATIETIVWTNPIAFFAQSGRLDVAELDGAVAVDQRELFEGNSVLRGQTPRVRAASSRDAAAPLVLERRRADARAASASTRPHLARARASAGAQRPLATVAAGGDVHGAVDVHRPALLPREHGFVGNGWYFRDTRRGLALAAVEPARRRREDLGRGEAARPGVHLREALLVVQHVRDARTSR